MKKAGSGGEGQDNAIQVCEGEHVVRVVAPPTAVEALPITKNRDRPFAPNLDLNGVVSAVGVIFLNVRFLVVGGEDDDVGETELLPTAGVAVGFAIGPAGVTAVARIIRPGDVGAAISQFQLRGRCSHRQRFVAEGHEILESGRPFFAPFAENEAQGVGAAEQGMDDRFVGVRDAVKAAMGEVGRDDAAEEFALAEHEAHRAGRARVGEGGVVHEGDFQVYEPTAANRANGVGVLAVEDGRKAGDVTLRQMFKHQVGIAQAGLRAHQGGVVGDFDG